VKQSTIFHPLVFSFFSRDLYCEVARDWRGRSWLYLLVLLAICCIPTGIWMHVGLSNFAEEDAPKIIGQMPTVTITDGKVSIDADEPYHIKDPDTGKVLAIIDTTGQVTSLDGTDAVALLTGDRLFVKKDGNKTEIHDLSGVEAFSFDQDWLNLWLGRIAAWGATIAFPFLLLGSYVYRGVQALLYAAIGLFLNHVADAKLRFPAILSVAMVAVTPAVVLKTLIGTVGVDLPQAWLVYFAVAMGYLYFGIQAGGAPADPDTGTGGPDAHPQYGTDTAYPSGDHEAGDGYSR
jgi:hypothetical protein